MEGEYNKRYMYICAYIVLYYIHYMLSILSIYCLYYLYIIELMYTWIERERKGLSFSNKYTCKIYLFKNYYILKIGMLDSAISCQGTLK